MTEPAPFLTFNKYLKDRFGERVQRVAIHAGFTCPNRDGSKGTGGCIYCDNHSFNPNLDSAESVIAQLETGMARTAQRYRARKFLAYFQTFSNTYGPLEELRKLYNAALEPDDVVGLMVSTRPDCLEDEVLDLLADLARTKLVWLELGVQTAWDVTLDRINRCHTWADSVDAIQRAHARNLPVAAHVILGLPGETPDQMLRTARELSRLNIDGVKLHDLHAVKGTDLAEMFDQGEWAPMDMDEYIETAALFIRELPKRAVIMRLTGDCPDHLLATPRWPLNKHQIRERIIEAIQLCSS